MKAEGFNTLQDKVQLRDPENARVFLTYDKGLALCGIFAAADKVTLDAVLPDQEAKAENTSETAEFMTIPARDITGRFFYIKLYI